jgi:hypothetical protein
MIAAEIIHAIEALAFQERAEVFRYVIGMPEKKMRGSGSAWAM